MSGGMEFQKMVKVRVRVRRGFELYECHLVVFIIITIMLWRMKSEILTWTCAFKRRTIAE